jgi:hypothetical protein
MRHLVRASLVVLALTTITCQPPDPPQTGVRRATVSTPTWAPRAAALAPTPRHSHAMAFDGASGKVMLFGGRPAGSLDAADTWHWDGAAGTWSQATPATAPPARNQHAMAYDAARGQVLLFGGTAPGGAYAADTWVWDGTTWSQRAPATAPSARAGHALVYDSARQVVVLFGGHDVSGTWNGEVWEWDGSAWTQRQPSSSPVLHYAVGAWDGHRQRVVFYGATADGTGQSNAPPVWEWDGNAWSKRLASPGPGSRMGTTMVGDTARGVIVLCSGIVVPLLYLNDTWEWDGARGRWTEQSPPTSPALRQAHALAFDEVRGRAVLFGGTDSVGTKLGDTWEYSVTSLDAGAPCTAAAAALCASGYCVDGVCCASAACAGTCQACNVAGAEGACAPVAAGDQDPDTCATSGHVCDGAGSCVAAAANGAACAHDGDCAAGHCVDGVCCRTACTETCRTCAFPGSEGTCTLVPAGEVDTNATAPCVVPRLCNNNGYCTPGDPCANANTCPSGYCADGVCCESECDAICYSCAIAGHEGACRPVPQQGEDDAPACRAADHLACNGAGACAKANAETCAGNGECASGYCVGGYCCNVACDGNCEVCDSTPGQCTLVPAGDDPRSRCQAASGGHVLCAGKCDGAGQCAFPDVGTNCGLCSACDGTGRCTATPADDSACDAIDCSGLDTACRIFQDLTSNRCAALGACKTDNDPATCTSYTDLECADGGPLRDAGPAPQDAGAAPQDAGTGGKSGGCRAAPGAGPARGGMLLLVVMALAVTRRRP